MIVTRSAEILTSAVKFNQFPEDKFGDNYREIKCRQSSFINNLLNRKSLARTSSVPGKTRTANDYYIINDEFYIVDKSQYDMLRFLKSEKPFSPIHNRLFKKRNADS